MNTKVRQAVDRLNSILPLTKNQKRLEQRPAELYRTILKSYIEIGRRPLKSELAGSLDSVENELNTLKEMDMIILDSDGEISGAYPFTSEARKHIITVNEHKIHAMCALDALAISPMSGVRTHIDSSCEVTGEPVCIDQQVLLILDTNGSHDLHFGIDWNAAQSSCCATSLCSEMIFLIDKDIASAWLAHDEQNRQVFTLEEAVDFAAQFFSPLLYTSAGRAQ